MTKGQLKDDADKSRELWSDGGLCLLCSSQETPPYGEGRDQRVCLTQTRQDSVNDLQVQVQLLTQHGKIPARGSAESAGLDVYAAHPSEIGTPCRSVVSLDVVFAIPTGLSAQMQPRSGLAAKHNIDLSADVSHSDFRGNVGGLLVNNCSDKFVLSQGDHIAQVLFKPGARPVLQKVPPLAQTTRESRGSGAQEQGTWWMTICPMITRGPLWRRTVCARAAARAAQIIRRPPLRRPKQVRFCTGFSAIFVGVICPIYLLFSTTKFDTSVFWPNYPQKCVIFLQKSSPNFCHFTQFSPKCTTF